MPNGFDGENVLNHGLARMDTKIIYNELALYSRN